jgi:hypothetical protein
LYLKKSSTGGIRTRTAQYLKLVTPAVGLPCQKSSVEGIRTLTALFLKEVIPAVGLRRHNSVGCEGIEPLRQPPYYFMPTDLQSAVGITTRILLHSDQLPVNAISPDPTVDVSFVVADLKAFPLNRFDQVQVLFSPNFTKDNISSFKFALYWFDCA